MAIQHPKSRFFTLDRIGRTLYFHQCTLRSLRKIYELACFNYQRNSAILNLIGSV